MRLEATYNLDRYNWKFIRGPGFDDRTSALCFILRFRYAPITDIMNSMPTARDDDGYLLYTDNDKLHHRHIWLNPKTFVLGNTGRWPMSFLMCCLWRGLQPRCGRLRMGLGTRNVRTGVDPGRATRHFTERAALFVPLFPIHMLDFLRLPDNWAKDFESLSASERASYKVVTVKGPNNVNEYYRLYIHGCFHLDRCYIHVPATDA